MRMLAALMVLCASAGVHAARPADLVKAEFVADVDAVKAGEPFKVGVLLKVKPGWHVYWKYPGDSGAATQVEIKMPDGWKVDEVQFPIPTRFDQPGGIVGYGYEDEVMLIGTITPPAQIDGSVELSASVQWLACEEVCFPGKAELKLSLPVRTDAKSADAERFKLWQERMPARGEPSHKSLRQDGSKFVATVLLDQPHTNIEWFPNPPPRTGVSNAQAKTMRTESTLSFELIPPPKELKSMSFLLAYTDPDGKRRGVEFALSPSKSQPQP